MTCRMADPERDRDALIRAWGRPRQPDYGPIVYVYCSQDAPSLKRAKSNDRRDYGGAQCFPVAALPATVKDRDVTLPTEQGGWSLVSQQPYSNGKTYQIRVRHKCGAEKFFPRSAWIKGRNLTPQCGGCFRPSRLMQDLGLGPKRKTCASCGAPVPPGRRQYCGPACGSEGKSAETVPRPREAMR